VKSIQNLGWLKKQAPFLWNAPFEEHS
jgi:hypothetical protein